MSAAPARTPVSAPELRADAARNRAAVLAVARRMLLAGDTSLPMNAIARAAGVGVGTVYRHFPTRQVLLESLAMGSFTRLLDEARAAAADADPGRGMDRLLRTALDCLLDDVGLAAVLQSGQAACTETSDLLGDLLTVFDGLLERARAVATIRPDVGPDDLRRYLCGLATGVRLGQGRPDQIDRDLDVLLTGLRPHR